MIKTSLLLLAILAAPFFLLAQERQKKFTQLDTLFGSNTAQRSWWDVRHYDVSVTPDYNTRTIRGKTIITYAVLSDQHNPYIQIDLQKPLQIDSIFYNGQLLRSDANHPNYEKGNHYFFALPLTGKGTKETISIAYYGKPKEATNPPWDGGWVWTKDRQGRPWISVACEDDGASLWYPCKDLWADEPDDGASLTITVPNDLVAVGNGRLTKKTTAGAATSFTWEVKSPINSYSIIPYIGHYVSWTDTLAGEAGKLDLAYWTLDYNRPVAQKQFEQVKPTLRAFERWFGPYPFYNDGYQLVEAPYLGMEHQSAVAYGNGFVNGYSGNDLSATGWGLKWDYIIVHETGHEWFGNNITAKDVADMWVHEGFTDYSETLFIDDYFGVAAGNEYTQGLRRNIANDRPIIGTYGVHRTGSNDMYYKGANLLHTIRQVVNDDEKFRRILRGLNKTFYHQTVTSSQVETYISQESGIDFSPVFNQYLRNTGLPVLEYRHTGETVQYRWTGTESGFALPLKLTTGQWVKPTTVWKNLRLPAGTAFNVDKNFYINVRKL